MDIDKKIEEYDEIVKNHKIAETILALKKQGVIEPEYIADKSDYHKVLEVKDIYYTRHLYKSNNSDAYALIYDEEFVEKNQNFKCYSLDFTHMDKVERFLSSIKSIEKTSTSSTVANILGAFGWIYIFIGIIILLISFTEVLSIIFGLVGLFFSVLFAVILMGLSKIVLNTEKIKNSINNDI